MITPEQAYERGFAIQTYSSNEAEYKFQYMDKTYTLPVADWVTSQLIEKDGIKYLPVYEDCGWSGKRERN